MPKSAAWRSAIVLFALAAHSTEAVAASHICWIDHVVIDGEGLRVYYNKNMGAPVAAKLGDHLRPSNSPEDGCDIEVQKRGGKLGVLANAFFYMPGLMTKPSQSHEWIEAQPDATAPK